MSIEHKEEGGEKNVAFESHRRSGTLRRVQHKNATPYAERALFYLAESIKDTVSALS
jgi:hypothetical protein